MTAHSRLPMFSKCALPLLAMIAACSDGDTVVAVNVNFKPTANKTQTVAVTITQSGQSPTETTLTIPMKESDAGSVVDVKDNRFVQRIVLPASYTDAETTVEVVAKDSSGKDIDSDKATFTLRPNEAIAAFVSVGEEPPKEPAKGETDAGAENTAGTEGAAGAAGAPEAESTAGTGTSAGASGSAGAAGAAGG